MNHLSAQITFKVKEGITLAADHEAVSFGLRYTSQGSSAINDMRLGCSSVVDQRQERVPGVRTVGQAKGNGRPKRSWLPANSGVKSFPN